MRIRNRYHTAFVSMFVAGVLSPQQYQNVPRSPRASWKKQDLSALVGTELAQMLEDQMDLVRDINRYKKLEQVTLAVHTVYITLTAVLDSIRSKKAVFRKNKEIILEAIDKIRPEISFQKALAYFQISSQQYYGWKRKLECPASPLSLCRRNHPLQLSFKEVQTIKKYLLDPKYLYWKMPSIQALMARQKAYC